MTQTVFNQVKIVPDSEMMHSIRLINGFRVPKYVWIPLSILLWTYAGTVLMTALTALAALAAIF